MSSLGIKKTCSKNKDLSTRHLNAGNWKTHRYISTHMHIYIYIPIPIHVDTNNSCHLCDIKKNHVYYTTYIHMYMLSIYIHTYKRYLQDNNNTFLPPIRFHAPNWWHFYWFDNVATTCIHSHLHTHTYIHI